MRQMRRIPGGWAVQEPAGRFVSTVGYLCQHPVHIGVCGAIGARPRPLLTLFAYRERTYRAQAGEG